jgi:hypothetical protein
VQAAALPAAVDVADVERGLDGLEALGARLFDGPSCDCIRSLLERAEELGGAAKPLLAARAEGHLLRLRERFERTRRETRDKLAQVEGRHGVQPALRDLLEIGDLARLRRTLRRLALTPPEHVRGAHETRREVAEYDESLAELVASFALARADDVVPEDAGPYNPLRIASELLTRMRAVSPLYLTAQLNRLEELASLLGLPELPGRAAPVTSKKKKALRS